MFLAAVRVAQFASTSTALGLLAYLMSTDNGSGFELAVSAVSLAHLLVVFLAPLPLNLYSLIALAVFEVAMLALWTAASGTLGVDYGEYSCSTYSYDDSYNYFFDTRSYFSSLARECRVGQASLAFASFSAFLSLCALCLLCVNVLAPMNAVFANGVHPEGASAHLRRFTGLAIARAPAAGGDVEGAGPVATEAAEPAVPVIT